MRTQREISGLCLIMAVLVLGLPEALSQQTIDPFTGESGNAPKQTVPDPMHQQSLDADREHRLVVRSRVELIQVPAIVTDRSGNRLHNLEKSDFRLQENGKQQKIALCEEVTAKSASAQPATVLPPNSFTNRVADDQLGPLTIIALDTINTPYLDQAEGRKRLLRYLAGNLGAAERIGLVVFGSKGVRVLQGLNGDPVALIAALKKATSDLTTGESFTAEEQALAALGSSSALVGPAQPGGDPDERMRRFVLFADALTAGYKQDRAIEDTMKAFLAIAWSVSGVPGRKSLIWLTGSFPFALDSPNTVPGSGLAALYEHTMQALNNAQVAVYPVDVRGLISNSPIVDPHYSTGARGSEMSAAITPRNFLQDTSVESLQNFADMTGGLAYFNNSDLGAGFKRATDDSSSYYMLSYYGNSNDNKAGWRKLRVEVNRKDAQVRARSGYFVTNATNDPKLTHQADVAFALSSPFDSTGIPVTIQWKGAAADGDKHKIGFALQIPETSVVDEGDQNRFDIEVVVQTSRNGTPIGDTSQTARGAIPSASLAKIKAEGVQYNNTLELTPGEYQVRFVVRDNLRGTIGSVSAPLTVR